MLSEKSQKNAVVMGYKRQMKVPCRKTAGGTYKFYFGQSGKAGQAPRGKYRSIIDLKSPPWR